MKLSMCKNTKSWKTTMGRLSCALLIAAVTLPTWVSSASAAQTNSLPSRVAVNAKGAIVMDATTHEVLFAKNMDTPMYPASTTKLMTAILLVTYMKPDDRIYISNRAANQPKVRLGLKTGTTISADEALHALLMKSANDVAFAVAETVGGSEQGFARMMNLKARLLGCMHTNFVTPNGLHEDEHMSSPEDIALILAEAIQHPQIVATMQTPSYTIAGKTINNGNRMMQSPSGAYGQAVGGKTGYTSKAMYCLAFAAKQNGHTRISVVLGAPRKSAMYRETRRLLEMSARGQQAKLVSSKR